MLALTEGSVFICGHATQGAGPERLASIRRQHIGFAFQSFHLFPTLTAEEKVRLALDVRGEQRRRAKVKSRQVLERIGLPRDLSGGEQQRVAIAGGIVAEPSAILADEPVALDGANGMTILASIARAHGRAVLVVTHDTRLLEFADRILYIEDGALTHEDQPGANVHRLRA